VEIDDALLRTQLDALLSLFSLDRMKIRKFNALSAMQQLVILSRHFDVLLTVFLLKIAFSTLDDHQFRSYMVDKIPS
jgi:ABC-type proline/glycine betaine transport system ATPase subunit